MFRIARDSREFEVCRRKSKMLFIQRGSEIHADESRTNVFFEKLNVACYRFCVAPFAEIWDVFLKIGEGMSEGQPTGRREGAAQG
jgi:hypothetical protein